MKTLLAALATFFVLSAPASADIIRAEIVATALAQAAQQDPAAAPVLPAAPVAPDRPAEVIPAPSAPAPVIVQAAPPPVSFPIGDIMAGLLGYVWVGLAGLVTFGLRKLPPRLYALAMTMQVEQLLKQAIAFGINSVKGATPQGNLDINVVNPVLRIALYYAKQHGGFLVKQFAGSPADLGEKIWARLNLAEDAVKPNFTQLANEVELGMPRVSV